MSFRLLQGSAILALVVIMAGISYSQDARVATVSQPSVNASEFVGYAPGSIVVKFDRATASRFDPIGKRLGNVGVLAVDAVNRRFNVYRFDEQFPGAKPIEYRGQTVDISGWHRVYFSANVDVMDVIAAYKGLAGVLAAEPVGIHSVDGTPNDTRYADQWHLNQANDHDMDAPEAWDIDTGSPSIIVADLDTGVRYFHKDLGGSNASYSDPSPTNINGNMWKNPGEIPGNGIDDDGNGYVDDWIGWDFISAGSYCYPGEDCTTPDNDPRDFNGHGTHTAGIVAALNNNGYGVASIGGGWLPGSNQPAGNGVKLMGLRIGWSAGRGSYEVGYVDMAAAASAFYYAANNGARIATCSWGNSNTGGIADAATYFIAKGGLIFNSAGNSNNETASYLCSREDVIAVASTDQNDLKSDFSTYGTWVDISAPGSSIWSTYHNHADPANDYVASLSGTSMSCPNAAAVAALIWSHNPTFTADQVKQKLFDTADKIDALNPTYAGKLGAGRVNAFAALSGTTPPPPTPPDAPSNLAASAASPTQINLSWTDNSTNESGFKIDRMTTVDPWAQIATVGAGVTTYSNTGLTPNTTYTYRVYAYNGAGNSVFSNLASATTPVDNTPKMHVASVVVTKEALRVKYRGKATVKIVDAGGNPVASATVSGSWSGAAAGNASFTTGSDGTGVTYSQWVRYTGPFTFCVNNVTKTGWAYDAAANVGNGCGTVNSLAKAVAMSESGADEGVPSLKDVRNYPNPFNPSTTIEFYHPVQGNVSVEIYDILGRKVTTLMNEQAPEGPIVVTWKGVDGAGRIVGSGQYFYVIRTEDGNVVRGKMLLLK